MKKRQKGFSLLELMTTIGIISIIGAVGFPAIDNFGDQENYETDLATIRGQINYVRQLSLEEGNAYTIRIVNDTTNNTANLEVWQAQGLNRYNIEYHRIDDSDNDPKCSRFNDEGENQKGVKLNNLTKKLEHTTINRCTLVAGSCIKEVSANNFFCFLPDGSSPENAKGEIQASGNAGGKKENFYTYETGFFNIGKQM